MSDHKGARLVLGALPPAFQLVYVGDIVHKEKPYRGEHPPIVIARSSMRCKSRSPIRPSRAGTAGSTMPPS